MRKETDQTQAADAFHQLGVEAARAMINLLHVPNESSFAATNAVSGMLNECSAYLMHAVGSDNVVAILDSISQQALMKNHPGAAEGVSVKMVNTRTGRDTG